MTTYNQFVQIARDTMQEQLAKIQSGKVQWTVSNQFDETWLERALVSLDTRPRLVEKTYHMYKQTAASSWTHGTLVSWLLPEIYE